MYALLLKAIPHRPLGNSHLQNTAIMTSSYVVKLFCTLTLLTSSCFVYWTAFLAHDTSQETSDGADKIRTREKAANLINMNEKTADPNMIPSSQDLGDAEVLEYRTIAHKKSNNKDMNVPDKYQPYRIVSYKRSGNKDRSVLVVPRRAYFDHRFHRGVQRNVLLILAQVHDSATNTIVACELNGHYSRSVSIIKQNTDWVRSHKQGYTHCTVVVQCLGLPRFAMINETFPTLIYKRKIEEYFSFVRTERPLVLQKFNSVPARGLDSVVVCTAMYGHPKNFDNWLKYQKTIGVDKVHLNTDRSFFDNLTAVYPFLAKALESGFVVVDAWDDVIGKRVFNYGQITKHQDCIFRHIDEFSYAFVYDYDDYFNPLLKHKNVHFYLHKLFSDSSVGSIAMSWRQMKCRPSEEKLASLQDGNLTSILSGYASYKRSVSKRAYRVNALMFVLDHKPQQMLSGYESRTTSDSLLYVAHNRHTNDLCT